MTTRIEREKEFHDESYGERKRVPLERYYSVTEASQAYYRRFLLSRAPGARLLEYGCGRGEWACELARNGAEVTGIDLSDTALDMAREAAARENLRVHFEVMNAEALTFPDGSFDIICGTGILHHLDLDKAYAELARTLKPGGRAIFLEPLGHNPLLNLFRRLTPKLRTVDEHPFRREDFAVALRYFDSLTPRFFHLSSMLAYPFKSLPLFTPVLKMLDALDRGIFALLPFIRMHAWIVVFQLDGPKRTAVTSGMSS